ncbi:Beta-galactosidase [Acidisarcina polymorpha]|uniref:Beta-galactosidase n=1 Tax=Acidisarcina polymorpha TaxID=2211140 RepID=A0A2Z5FWY7_9BACT|nr:sugar-binding domain-containing protein [Acidisarcina polymorpha]AXC11230.1 Beta-galactosidase [Acidisarcina polymorpha]
MNDHLASSQQRKGLPFPRPQMEREFWISLDGTWDFCSGRETSFSRPDEVQWDQRILVPFSPETAASGVGDTGFYSTVWYRRSFESPGLDAQHRLILHFEAVDYRATVWVNGQEVATHEGGYTPFKADITRALREGTQEIIVRAQDDPADLEKPRGKQDWKLEPHSIWYPRTTGIWQTVWLEVVAATHISSVHWSSNLESWEICLTALVNSELRETALRVRLLAGGQLLALDTYAVIAGEVHRRIALSDPGIDDYRNTLLWSPQSPTIIDALLELLDEEGKVIDSLRSYTAIRTVTTQRDRFVLNGRPLNLRLVLDQGYWPESGATAPSDDALRRDVELAKRLGFNGVRKHQKIESERYHYWADRLGLLVWEEMPSAYRYTTRSIHRLTREWLEVLERDKSHPCIVSWVPFNESWGVPDLPDSPAQRHYVQALYHLTKCIDSSRPVIGNDGWESVATDIIGIHDYDDQPERLGLRYGIKDVATRLLKRERPGGRMLQLGEADKTNHPIVLTEFGGIAFGEDREAIWGYSQTESADDLLSRYSALLNTVRQLPLLAGFCYTQFTDTYQEANGLLYADRRPKVPFHEVARATTGSTESYDAHIETLWREQILQQ